MAIKTIKRTIHFYDLIVEFNPEFILDKEKYQTNFQALLSKIKVLVFEKNVIRYQSMGEKILFINDLTISPQPNKMIIQGKLLSVRKDFFPELLNTITDTTRDISAAEEEGIVETTHFVIQQKSNNVGNKLKLALEFNQFGAKISDLEYYLARLGENLGITKKVEHAAIIRDSLKKTKDRIGEISRILIKVEKDNLSVLEDVDAGIFSAFQAAQEAFSEDYLTMEFKYDINKAREAPTSNQALRSKNIISKFITSLLKNKSKVEQYQKLEVIAEDSDRNNKLNAFDLLIDKVKDIINVERREKSRTVVSLDMFAKMNDSWTRNRIL